MGGACFTHWGDKKYNISVGKPEGEHLGDWHRWEYNIKTGLEEAGYECVELIYLA
jgi:hypothetical protein